MLEMTLMMDVSKETNVQFLRHSHKYLQEKVIELERTLAETRAKNQTDEELCARLSEDLLLLRKKFFKGGRETLKKQNPDKPRPKVNLPHNQCPVVAPEGQECELASEEVIHSLEASDADCDSCSEPMKKMESFEESCEIAVTERKYILRRHKREKFVCRQCNKLKTASGPQKLISGGKFSLDMAVQVAEAKFSHHTPLERQRKAMLQSGLRTDTKTLYRLTEYLAGHLDPAVILIRSQILSQRYVCLDETRAKILTGNSNGYVWCLSNNFGAYFQYELTRSGKVAREILSGYKGPLITDAYSGYLQFKEDPRIELFFCLSHLRRKFFDAIAGNPRAEEAVDLIDQIFILEHEAKDFSDVAMIRRDKSSKVVQKIDLWRKRQQGTYLKSSRFGEAIQYLNNHWTELTKFINNPFAPLDNNLVERILRDPVMGRKNFQGFRTINGADVAMTFYTIIRSCKLVRLDPGLYMRSMALAVMDGKKIQTPYDFARQLYGQTDKEALLIN